MKGEIKFHPAQQQIADALMPAMRGAIIMCIAGRRFGKTVLGTKTIADRALKFPYSRSWYVHHTKTQAYQVAWKMMLNEWRDENGKVRPPMLPPEVIRKKREDRHTIELHNGSVITLQGVQDLLFILGEGLEFCVIDEFPHISYTSWYDTIEPMLADRNGDALFIGTVQDTSSYTVTPEFMEMYETYLNNPTKDRAAFNFSSFENPTISHDKIKNSMDELNKQGRKADAERLYLGYYSKKSGFIFPAFDYDTHTVSPKTILPPTWLRLFALDPHPQKPYVGLWAALDRKQPRPGLWYYREKEFTCEHSGRILTLPEVVYEINQAEQDNKESIRMRLIDPTYAKVEQTALQQKSVMDQFKEYGMLFVEGDRNFNVFFNDMSDRLVDEPEPSVHIFQTCVNTIRQFQRYSWDQWANTTARQERGFKDRPKKKDDDYVDCSKYICNAAKVVKPIDDIEIARHKAILRKRWENRQYM